MKDKTQKRLVLFFVLLSAVLVGCMEFTQRDYDLQEKAYNKEQKEKEEAGKDTLQYRW